MKITDFEIGDKYAARMRNGSWVGVCLPAFPKGKNGDPKALKVLEARQAAIPARRHHTAPQP